MRRRFPASNPAAEFSPRLDAGGTERARSRALSTDELAQLFEKIRETPSFGEDNLLAIRLLLALCVRKGELLGARVCGYSRLAVSTSSRSVAAIHASGYRMSASTR